MGPIEGCDDERTMITEQRDAAPRLQETRELEACLREAFAGRSVRILGHERLKADVHRVRAEIGRVERRVVVKRSDPVVARRCWLVARRWLPAVGLEDRGPPLIAVVPDRTGQSTWHVYDDLRGRQVSTEPPVSRDVDAAIDAIARVHTAFAGHALLPECRLLGGDRGMYFYSTNVNDAVAALRSLDLDDRGEHLVERLQERKREEAQRARVLAAAGGPETLLHGDLWPTNAIALTDGDSVRVRLIDWDEAAAGPAGFDVSTFLLRFPPSYRGEILDRYRSAVRRLAGWTLPGEGELNEIFETAAYARLASLLVWSIAAAADGDSDWLPERLADVVEWIDEVSPVLPGR